MSFIDSSNSGPNSQFIVIISHNKFTVKMPLFSIWRKVPSCTVYSTVDERPINQNTMDI